MAERAYSVEYVARGTQIVTWTGLLNGDTGAPFDVIQKADKTFQASGTFSTGGTIAIEGSLDSGASKGYDTLKDGVDNPLTLTSSSQLIDVISEKVYSIRPNVTAGDGSTDLTVKMVLS